MVRARPREGHHPEVVTQGSSMRLLTTDTLNPPPMVGPPSTPATHQRTLTPRSFRPIGSQPVLPELRGKLLAEFISRRSRHKRRAMRRIGTCLPTRDQRVPVHRQNALMRPASAWSRRGSVIAATIATVPPRRTSQQSANVVAGILLVLAAASC